MVRRNSNRTISSLEDKFNTMSRCGRDLYYYSCIIVHKREEGESIVCQILLCITVKIPDTQDFIRVFK